MISSLIFALSSNLDNFVVGLTYGIKKIKINLTSLLLIAFITTLGTVISMSLGKIVVYFITVKEANIIGGLILIFLGLWTIIKYYLNFGDILSNPEIVDRDKSLTIDSKEATVLALALSMNNIGLGIGASISGISFLITAISTFVFSIILMMVGRLIGKKYFPKSLESKATLFSGILIIILGIYEIYH